MARIILLAAGISGALAVALGAMGAHALRDVLDIASMDIYTKAASYHLSHTLALFGVGLLALSRPSRTVQMAAIAFGSGIVLFSGSLYAFALTGVRALGMITPFGGIAFIMGWLLVAKAAWRIGKVPVILNGEKRNEE
ncbi:MAG: DUF423 domain-containing protein [Bacteroidetes bacterium]|nr:DUF423 domain-containing protein [Bacteroidota bacterium]